MCGIAGIIKFTPQPDSPRAHQPALTAMSAAIAHRGPDGSGQFIDPRPNTFAALLHRRLAILDHPGGTQPMPNEDGTVHVIFNGEIYNHADLRRELQQAGHTFRSHHSDTEVLVHGWEQWGTDLPAKLTGMFAFAIWDARAQTLFLARDRMGQKPLFYATLEDGIVFGSTIPSVLTWPEVPRRTPRELLATYLQLGYLPAPQTIWRDVSALPPGHWLRLRSDVLDGGRYWSQLTRLEFEDFPRNFPSYALEDLLPDAVKSQLISDVPIACFLSGGLDSSVIAMLMQEASAAMGGPAIQTVSVGFADPEFDESAYAQAVAGKIGSHHTRLEVNPTSDPMGTLRALMHQSLGQPFADSSILPTFHLSKAVRQIAPVALSGDGGDELFGGYDRYRAMQLLSRWSGPAKLLPKALPLRSLQKRERYRRLARAAHGASNAERYARLMEIFPLREVENLLQQPCGDFLSHVREIEVPPAASAFRYALMHDRQDYLPNDLLWKVDSASMSVALEVRSPFLDHSVVEFSNTVPDTLLRRNGFGKFLLRDLYGPSLPPAILARPKKGFAVPIGTWFRTTLRQPLHDLLLSPNSFVTTHLHRPTIEKLLTEHDTQSRDHTHRLFALLMLELWAQEFHPTVE